MNLDGATRSVEEVSEGFELTLNQLEKLQLICQKQGFSEKADVTFNVKHCNQGVIFAIAHKNERLSGILDDDKICLHTGTKEQLELILENLKFRYSLDLDRQKKIDILYKLDRDEFTSCGTSYGFNKFGQFCSEGSEILTRIFSISDTYGKVILLGEISSDGEVILDKGTFSQLQSILDGFDESKESDFSIAVADDTRPRLNTVLDSFAGQPEAGRPATA